MVVQSQKKMIALMGLLTSFSVLTLHAQISATIPQSFDNAALPQTEFVGVDSSSTQSLQDVIVVGYGTQKKANLSTAIASVKSDEFKDQPVSNLASSMQGKVTGINVTTASGTPGSGLLVSVRGANNPLYVVDGIPMLSESNSQISTSFDANGVSVGSGQNLSSIADINPNDIESIEILKDASAASIYGARSANGVILITTKKGTSGKTNYGFNYYTGFQKVRKKLDLMGSKDLIAYIKKGFDKDKEEYQKLKSEDDKQKWIDRSLLAGTDIADVDDYFAKGINYYGYKVGNNDEPYIQTTWDDLASLYNTDWQDEVMNSSTNASIQNIELNARGGNDKSKFYISGGYFKQNGLLIKNYFERYSGKLNYESKLNNQLTIGTNTTLALTNNRRSLNDNTYSGILTNAIPNSPLTPTKNAYDADNGYFFDYTVGNAAYLTDNPYKAAHEFYAFTKGYRILTNMFAEYKLLKNLKLKTTGSADFSLNEDVLNISNITTDAAAFGGKGQSASTKALVLLNENTLDYNTKIEGHNLSVLLGHSMQKSETNITNINTVGFLRASPNYAISNGAFTTIGAGSGNLSWFVMSFFGRVNYDYEGKYITSLSLRSDGSSRFASDKRWGIFPAVSVAWNIHKESFLQNNKFLTGLKLRGSWGIAGDQEIGLYKYLNLYTPSGYNLAPSYYPSSLADKSITWQKNNSINVGFDYDILNGKFSGSIEYYVAKRTDILIPVPTSGVTGASTIIKNAGEITDQGIELSLNYKAIQTQNLKLNFSANLSTLKNEVTKLPVDNQLFNVYTDVKPSHILKKGYSVGAFWGIQSAGTDENGNALFYNSKNEKVSYYDINYDTDARVIGKARPDFFGGFGMDMTYKAVDLSIDFTYSYGNDVYNIFRAVYDNGGYAKLNAPAKNDETGEWEMWYTFSTYSNKFANEGPRPSLIKRNYVETSSRYVEDGSFIRCKNINLGYTLRPKNQNKDAGVQSLRLYAQVQNLFVITKYSGYDPEVSATGGSNPYTAGVDYATYPQPTTYTLGVSINFK